MGRRAASWWAAAALGAVGAAAPGPRAPAAAQEAPPAAAPDPGSFEIDPPALRTWREEAFERALVRAREALAPGWALAESKRFVAVSHVDAKSTREVLAHAEALRDWLDQQFGFVGSGFAGRVFLRLCADPKECEELAKARAFTPGAPEAFGWKDRDGAGDRGLDSLNVTVAWTWLRDRNDALVDALPLWFEEGLRTLIARGRTRNGRIEFKPTTGESVDMMKLRRADELLPARAFFTSTSAAFRANRQTGIQARWMLDFLMTGAASRSPKYRDLLGEWLKGIVLDLDLRPSDPRIDLAVPKTPKEAQDLLDAKRNRARAREPELLSILLDRCFPGWTDRDWDAFDALHRQDVR